MSKEKKAGVIIGNYFYRFEELQAIWHYFRMNGVPEWDFSYGYKMSIPNCLVVDQHRGDGVNDYFIRAYDHLSFRDMAIAYFNLYDAFKKLKAQLELKDRKPLTKAQFESNAYENYLKAFDADTKRLKKEAGIEEK